MKLAASIALLLFFMAIGMLGLNLIREGLTSSSQPPGCTNTTIDKYYKCESPTVSPLLSR